MKKSFVPIITVVGCLLCNSPVMARILIDGVNVKGSLHSVFRVPGQTVEVALPSGWQTDHDAPNVAIIVDASHQTYQWQSQQGGEDFTLQVFSLIPAERVRNGRLGNYMIGTYPVPPKQNTAAHQPPAGFLQVSPRLVDMQITDHFSLRPFISKQPGEFPKYLYLNDKLLAFLEDFRAAIEQQGFDIQGFGFISGYRTPHYNQQLDNINHSQHMYGNAADIYVDVDQDGRLDDLNRDGQHNASDAKFLFGLAERFMRSSPDYKGGLGLYVPTRKHTGFIHVDVRGYPARW
ncbi:D-Ala-D-Ala carboxypeptidase family metallohydrolase [Aestuariibacter halophilus]|uniref:D-Ala-D-Ala carboxypeptidase family metallohydrolase n=1 Tax=Fluctibacter halophilus TaxID=226011 RepID=A0ABS8G538_9ALTE|nr:D-Ala-D-Ala carboxypeptidase family metallohydrolase [Aestuariibacter halophilus]MCC2615697.1 D-Ala-D-Ala carboxypeptidase family metallohydrolase [Aestuariibacter halophilus]